jgi:hypothetical protein
VWALPEVQSEAAQLRGRGSRPVTLTITEPDPRATPGSQAGVYLIRLSEDRGDNVTAVETFAVDAYSKQVSVYDVIQDRSISLEEWRGRR